MMNRTILIGALALAVAVPGLLAQPKPKSEAELEALKTMFAAQNPDERIAACQNVLTKFADTEFKAVALYFEAISYEQKGNYEQTVVFGERTLEADPKHYQAMLMLAEEIAQHTKEFDLDKADKLAQVEKYAKNALELVKDAPKPNPNLTDDQWVAARKEYTAQAHVALGTSALVSKKFDAAEKEYKTALEVDDKPDAGTMVRLGKAYSEEGKYDDAIAQFDKVMAIPDVNARVKQVAQAERVRAIQKKGGANANSAAPKPDAPKPDAPKPDAPKPEAPKPEAPKN
jgi:tetratricopeptide (TPR) repeat protein